MGEMEVPDDAYYGASTMRAVQNFPISGIRFPRRFIWALGLIKKAAAEVNLDLGLLDAKVAQAIDQAAGEVAEGKLDADFPLDIYQTRNWQFSVVQSLMESLRLRSARRELQGPEGESRRRDAALALLENLLNHAQAVHDLLTPSGSAS